MYRPTPEIADFYNTLKEELEQASKIVNRLLYNIESASAELKFAKDKLVLLIAPHPDDELIGAYTLIRSKKIDMVWYIEEGIEDDRRRKELEEVAKVFGFRYTIIPWEDLVKRLDELANPYPEAVILVPDPRERHPLHRYVTASAEMVALTKKRMRIGYYSTQMNASYVRLLPPEVAQAKREALLTFYGSQASLFESDHKYWLYEGVVVCLD